VIYRHRDAAEGTLMIQFGVVDGRQTNAVDAVQNLRRRLLPGARQRSRRSVDTGGWLLTSTVDNQTITPTDLYNWTGTPSNNNSRQLLLRSFAENRSRRKMQQNTKIISAIRFLYILLSANYLNVEKSCIYEGLCVTMTGDSHAILTR